MIRKIAFYEIEYRANLQLRYRGEKKMKSVDELENNKTISKTY
jgi:hypothetical protein